MVSSRKKVIVRSSAGAIHPGYLSVSNFVVSNEGPPFVPFFDLDAKVVPFPLASIRYVAYVRDFNREDLTDPERLSRRTFLARPRTEGLWLRLTLADGPLEGLAPLDSALADGLMEDLGLFLIPPDIRSNTQRIYVPRSSFRELKVLAVITNPSKTGSRTSVQMPTSQAPAPRLPFPDTTSE